MAFSTMSTAPRSAPVDSVVLETANVSAVSWPAVFAGALGAVAASVILIELGVGLGFSSVSAWTNSGVSLGTLGVMGGVWLLLVQWIASGIGGYLAGRLRTKWVGVHTDEVFFRDTAHGFLAWSLGTVIGVLLIAAGAASTLSAGARVAGAAVGGAAVAGTAAVASQSAQPQPTGDTYYVDMLFRPAAPPTTGSAAPGPSAAPSQGAGQGAGAAPNGGGALTAAPSTPAASTGATANNRGIGDDRATVLRIFSRDMPNGNLTPDDRAYVAQIVAARAGLPQAEAEQRVDQTVAQIKSAEDQARQAADKARKATAFGSIATSLAMLVGAFIACVTAALGGRLRDEYHP